MLTEILPIIGAFILSMTCGAFFIPSVLKICKKKKLYDKLGRMGYPTEMVVEVIKSLILEEEPQELSADELAFEELSSSYANTLEKMPEGQRVVFLMSRNEDLKYHEIAECLNISVKAVEKRMSAALQFLRTELL